ncbi:MAG: hypothetical protein IKZ32_02755 [Alistipes sp.]|nr:hypothetical protein [Alistipes sp.]
MDIVITYVNGLDPVWQAEYEKHTNTPILDKRFRDWGTLKYLFRGIAKNMPFIRKVHLVVSGESQVPDWINRDEVNVVLHKDIIPSEYLPTFNCNPIEMHLHRIKDLDEEYLYFNDDMFPMRECKPTDFFRDGKGVIRVSYHLFAFDMFKQICRNSTRVAREAAGRRSLIPFMRPQHICSPMLKSVCEEVYDKVEPEIRKSITITRTGDNLNQYLFLDYMYLKGKIINERISKKHFSVGIASATKLQKFVTQPTHKMACINDVQLSEERYEELRKVLLESFDELFPEKSRFEL